MTLGEFRRITEKFGDDCVVGYAEDLSRVGWPTLAGTVVAISSQQIPEEPEKPEEIILV